MIGIHQNLAHVLMVNRGIVGGRIPVEQTGTETDDTTLSEIAIVILQLPRGYLVAMSGQAASLTTSNFVELLIEGFVGNAVPVILRC